VLIPSIDLQHGRVVQLVQGENLAIASDDLDGWIARFAPFSMVQVIDLDAAMGQGDNAALVEHIMAQLPCQVGGGVRTVEHAQSLLDRGARRVILGSSLFTGDGVNIDVARAFSSSVDPGRLVGAVDSRGGRVTIHGWKTTLPVSARTASGALTPHVGAFLYTHVDTEGTMTGLDLPSVLAVQRAAGRPLIAAGGIRTLEEVDRLDALGIDAVVGMAVYTGAIDLDLARRRTPDRGNSTPPRPV
jgi:phosphoribosylformimino-5-aminoimidazole carboxamide ribotide isomerase